MKKHFHLVASLVLNIAAVGTLGWGSMSAPHAYAAAPSALAITNLRCEYATNPLGLGTTAPRLSWELRSDARGERQTAYQIVVAQSEVELEAGSNAVWDTGKVASDRTAQIAYAGAPLHSSEGLWWKVRVWGADGADAGWSAPARFETGLLSPDDWKGAQWVGIPSASDSADPFTGARWIWTAEGAGGKDAPIGSRTFERHIMIPIGATVARATLAITADDQYRVAVNGGAPIAGASDFESWKRPSTVDLTTLLKPGDNTITVTATNTTVSPAGLLAGLTVTFADGRAPLHVVTDGAWQTGGTSATAATEVAPYGAGPWGRQMRSAVATVDGDDGGPGRYLRHVFSVAKPIRSARLYATALGIYEPYVNGKQVGHDVFAPGWTDYRKRVPYQTFDVTPLLKQGSNAVGLLLSDGWFAGHIGLASRGVYGKEPAGKCLLRVEYVDGTTDTIATDSSWRGTTGGPVLAADLQSGESYDARKEWGDWSAAGFDDKGWQAAQVAADFTPGPLEAQRGPAVHQTQELPARSVRTAQPGHYLFDLGQNMVGWARLKVEGRSGREGDAAVRRDAEQGRHGLHHQLPGRALCRYLHAARGCGRRDVRPTVHVSGLSLCRGDGLAGRNRAGQVGDRRHRRRVRHAAHGDDGDLVVPCQPTALEYRLGTEGQLPVGPDRLPAARRAAGLDGRCPDLRPHGHLQPRCRRFFR